MKNVILGVCVTAVLVAIGSCFFYLHSIKKTDPKFEKLEKIVFSDQVNIFSSINLQLYRLIDRFGLNNEKDTYQYAVDLGLLNGLDLQQGFSFAVIMCQKLLQIGGRFRL